MTRPRSALLWVGGAAWLLARALGGAEVAAYSFSEGTGAIAADSSPSGNHAVLQGAAWSGAGRYGSALSLDGAGSKAVAGDAGSLDLQGELTLEAWVRPSVLGGWSTILMKEATGELSYALYANEEQPRPGVWVHAGGISISASGGDQLPLNVWTHLAGTYDGSTLRLYVDGVEVAQSPAAGPIDASDRPLSLGGNDVWGEYYRGLIDEVRIHDRALGADEIQESMTTPVPPSSGPSVPTITSPFDGSLVSGTVPVNALPSSGVAVAGMQFLLDGSPLGAEDTAPPFSLAWNTTSTGDGPHSIAARERLVAGGTRTSAAVAVSVLNSGGASLDVDGDVRHQVISGFGVNANSASWNEGELAPAVDLLVDVQGATLWRVIVECHEGWEVENDNGDPFTLDRDYYSSLYETPKFRSAWGLLEYLDSKGVQVMLNIMGAVPAWMGRTRIDEDKEDEWVEMIASFLLHGRTERGVAIRLLSPFNEIDLGFPEGPAIDAPKHRRLLRKLLSRLEGLGLDDVQITGPDTASIDAGLALYLPEMLDDAQIMARLDHFVFHSYTGLTGDARDVIAGSDYPDRDFWISEWSYPCSACDSGTQVSFEWDFSRGTVLNLLSHIEDGAAGAMVYDAYDSYYEHHGATGYWGQLGLEETGEYVPRKRFYANAQVFRFVAPGSVRIGLATASPLVQAHAFLHPGTGRVTIVGHHAGAQNLTLTGLLENIPLPTALEHYQTNESVNLVRRLDVLVSGGAFSVTLPPDTIFTLASPAPPEFRRGDSNGDGSVDVSDSVRALLYLFQGGSAACLDALDADDNGRLEVTDPIRLLGYLFRDGEPPPPPFPAPGPDGTPDDLDCGR